MAVMDSNSDETVLRQPPVASKMTILPSQILPDPDLQISPFKKGILRKETNHPKSYSNVRFNLKHHPLADLSNTGGTGVPADFSCSGGTGSLTESNLTYHDPSSDMNTSHPATNVSFIPLNSSNHILHKINALTQNEEGDMIKELQRQLNVDKKKEINEKAASKVDFKPDSVLYPNLISLDVPVVRVKKKKKPVLKKKTQDTAPPMFYDSAKENIYEEKCNFSLQGIPPPRVKLLKSPPLSTFTLYQHNKAWEGLLIHNQS